MGDLFSDMPEVIVYFDNVLVIGASSFEQHLAVVDKVLYRLEKLGLQATPKRASGQSLRSNTWVSW